MSQTRNAPSLDDVLRRYRDRHLPPPDERRRIREALGITQRELAEVLGVERATYTRWELGSRTPRGTDAERYRQLLQRLAREANRVAA
jgi:DNA-binding transcriptional regulator YiaG